MKTKLFTMLTLLILMTGCNEFSDIEEHVIKDGRLLNEAVSSEYYDFTVKYWDSNILVALNEYAEDFEDEALEDMQNIYSFWGDNLISNSYLSDHEKKAETIEYVIEQFDKSYDLINDVIRSNIAKKGIRQTSDELDSIIKKIESNDQEWYFNEDENTFEAQLGHVIAHPRYGYGPEIIGDFDAESIVWRYYLTNDINTGTNDNCTYAVLKTIQQWLNNKKNDNISVVYCLPYEDSLNSYLIGYSNHKSFMITFLRNDEENCRYEWQEMEYESTYVGHNLLE